MKILIIGGDDRFVSLKDILIENNFKVYDAFLNSGDENLKNLNKYDIIFLPIPFERNSKLNAPHYNNEVPSSYILDKLKHFEGKIIGGFDQKNENFLRNQNLNFQNILKDEKFTLINAIITAEGSIEKLIHESYKSLFESKVCILGYGRVSKALARRLQPLCKDLVVYNNPSINLVYTQIDNIKSNPLNNFKQDACKYDIIINTIPHLIVDSEILDTLNKNTFILDLASLPGGINFSYAEKLKLKVDHFLGVPSKVSKYSSANAILNFLLENLN